MLLRKQEWNSCFYRNDQNKSLTIKIIGARVFFLFSRSTLASPADHMLLNTVWSPQFYWAGGCGGFRMRSLISCDVVVWPILISFPSPSSKCLIRSLLVYCQTLQHLWFPPLSFSDLFLFPHVRANLCKQGNCTTQITRTDEILSEFSVILFRLIWIIIIMNTEQRTKYVRTSRNQN